MIGNDPRYQAIIDAYTSGAYNAPYQSMDYTPSPYYNPIYDIRREQIKAGELEEGARFPKPQLVTTPTTEEEKKKDTFDPCPPGYQLVDGVCQPDTMFDQGGGRDREPFTGPKISREGLIEGYEQVLPAGLGPESGALNSMQMMELENRFGPEIASRMGELNRQQGYRGIQYNPTTGQFVAMSPTTLSGTLGAMFSPFGQMLGSALSAGADYLGSGGMLGALANLFTPKQPTVNYGGSSSMTVTETGQPMILTDTTVPTGINRPGYPITQPTTPTGINRPGYTLPEPKISISFGSDDKKQSTPKTPKKGTGASGPPGRDYSSARSRAAQAAKKLGKKLATGGR